MNVCNVFVTILFLFYCNNVNQDFEIKKYFIYGDSHTVELLILLMNFFA